MKGTLLPNNVLRINLVSFPENELKSKTHELYDSFSSRGVYEFSSRRQKVTTGLPR